MQREQRHLDAEADDEAGHSNREQRRVQMRHNACSEVCHVQRTGHGIQIADAQQIERSANRADQQVTEGCQHGFSAAQGNQAIAGQRHNLQIYIEVENVARDNHARQTNCQQAEQRIIAAHMQPVLILDERTAVERNHHRNKGYDYGENAVQGIQRKFNTDRRRPATHPVMPGFAAGGDNLVKHNAGISKGTGDGGHHDPRA